MTNTQYPVTKNCFSAVGVQFSVILRELAGLAFFCGGGKGRTTWDKSKPWWVLLCTTARVDPVVAPWLHGEISLDR